MKPTRRGYRDHTKPTRWRCPQCGSDGITFTTSYGSVIHLAGAPLPANADLRALKEKGTVWVQTSSGEWTSKFGCNRDWRDTRIEHQCEKAEEQV